MNSNVFVSPALRAPTAVNAHPDFLDYLAERRGISREMALDFLGETVLSYEPETRTLRARRAELNSVLLPARTKAAS
ncbi:MAG: hypothetical protein B6A08_17925 [Sorangiineae bacterium NIC37A_2]|jgi:hypothetical protein|nr:MAG: hypothetical protein B6A08_17925 [Sorangiineae bacterium NIC37A_2]